MSIDTHATDIAMLGVKVEDLDVHVERLQAKLLVSNFEKRKLCQVNKSFHIFPGRSFKSLLAASYF